MHALGCRPPQDDVHRQRYSLDTLKTPPKNVPVTIGIPWFSKFGSPTLVGDRFWMARGYVGELLGYHCVCLKCAGLVDAKSWYTFYNQGNEPECCGFGSSRMMSLLNRKRYDAHWLYHEAQKIDGFNDNEGGTSVRATMDVLRTQGHWVHGADGPDKAQGIAANYWTTNVQVILSALGTPTLDHVVVLNSWGTDFPPRVFLAAERLQWLLDQGGEATVVTDRP